MHPQKNSRENTFPLLTVIIISTLSLILKSTKILSIGFEDLVIINIVVSFFLYSFVEIKKAFYASLLYSSILFTYGVLQHIEPFSFFLRLTITSVFFSVVIFLLFFFKERAARILERNESLFRNLAHSIPHPIIIKNGRGVIKFASKSIEDILGISYKKLIGKSLEELMHPEDVKDFKIFYKDLISTPGKKSKTEFRLKTIDGNYKWVENSVVNLLSDHRIKGVVATFQDIDTRKNLDEENKLILESERNARSLAEEAIKNRDEFLSIASHELKTPLTTILLQIQTTLRKLTTQSLADFSGENLMRSLKIAEEQSQRLSLLIRDLLNVSVARTGRLQLEKNKADLKVLVSSIITRFEGEIKLSGCKVTFEERDQKIIGEWDYIRIEQAVVNLLTNALKYGKGKPVKISIYKDKNYGYLSVEDHGIGISREDSGKVFAPFERAQNSGKKGLGVGLFIAKQIAMAHDGDILFNSTKGKGTEFILKLPLG